MLPGFVGGAGNAMMFVSLFVGEVIVGLLVLMYAAHCFLLVVEDTAAGNDAVYWPDEPLTDRFWKLFYLVWLAAVWLVPPWLLLRLLDPGLLETHPLRVTALAGIALWLLFPIALLSSLGAASMWMVVRPQLFVRMVRHFRAVAIVYAVTAVLLAGCAALIGSALFTAEFVRVPIAALAAATTLLLYARMLGRLTWVLHPPEPDEEPEPPEKPRPADGAPRRQPAIVEQPADAPEPRNGYGLQDEDLPIRPRPSPLLEHEAEEAEQGVGPTLARIEAARARRSIAPPPPPKRPLLSGIYTFPWYLTSLQAWIKLSLSAMILLAGGRLLVLWWPQ